MAQEPPLFSVIIPTLQKSDRLEPLVDMFCAHQLVGEVIIINNAANSLSFDQPKLRVLQQERNIFVNPAWNLGAREARFPMLAISNDDIAFDSAAIDTAARALRFPVGIVGPAPGSLSRRASGKPWLLPTYLRRAGFGTLMFLRVEDYVPIPEDLRVWAGDDWLFYRQAKRNLYLMGMSIETRMGTTSGSPEFEEMKREDRRIYEAKYRSRSFARRFWFGIHTHAALYRLGILND